MEDFEALRSGYEAFNAGDPDSMLAFADPEIVWYEFAETPGTAGKAYVGHEGLRQVIGDFTEAYDEFSVEVEELQRLPDHRVLALVKLSGRFRGTGGPVEARVAHLWTMRDGKAIEMRPFWDRSEARRAAGL